MAKINQSYPKFLNQTWLRRITWLSLALVILLAMSGIGTVKIYRQIRADSQSGIENYPEIARYIDQSVESALSLIALADVPDLKNDALTIENQLLDFDLKLDQLESKSNRSVQALEKQAALDLAKALGYNQKEANNLLEAGLKTRAQQPQTNSLNLNQTSLLDLVVEKHTLYLSKQLKLTELSYEYLESLSSEIKPLALEVYILPLLTGHDRSGQFPANRLNYPPPPISKLIYSSPLETRTPPTSIGHYAFVNNNYLAQNVGTLYDQADPEALLVIGQAKSNFIPSLYPDQSYDYQIIVFSQISQAQGRQSKFIQSVVDRRQKLLAAVPRSPFILSISGLLLCLALGLGLILVKYAWQSQLSSKAPLDLLPLAWSIFALGIYPQGQSINSIAPIPLAITIAYDSLVWTLIWISLFYLFYLLLNQIRNRSLFRNLVTIRCLSFLIKLYSAFKIALASWPREVRRRNRLGFLLVAIILILIAIFQPVFSLILILPLLYIGGQFFLEISYLIRLAEKSLISPMEDVEYCHLEDSSRPIKARLFSLLKPLEEALKKNRQTSQENLQAKLKSERMKADLITNVSHDIKTPITSILSYSSLLKQSLKSADQLSSDQADYLDIIIQQTARLQSLSSDLIESSRLHSGAVKLDLSVIDLSELLNQALAEYHDQFAQMQLSLIADLPDQLLVIANGDAMWRVLGNLLSNIVKYSRPDSRVYLNINLDSKQNMANIWLRNISQQALHIPTDELLERFVQGDRARTSEGSGLGLSIASSLVDLMHGNLSLTVVADLFTVQISLPLAPQIGESGGQADQL